MNILAEAVSISWLEDIKERNILRMTNLAEKRLNPKHYNLSKEAKKRLHWLNVLYYEQGGNVTKAANRIGISRPWLSQLKTLFETKGKDPRVLEPESKAPHNTKNRKRIPKKTEDKILEVRKLSKNVWGKVKIAVVLERDHHIKISPNTVNKYLHKHKLIDPKISAKNSKAWQAKKARDNPEAELFVRYRPPKAIKDLAPGALVEKDMKYIEKQARMTSGKDAGNFYSQHTEIDSFTRIRSIELSRNASAKGSAEAHEKSKEKFSFVIACENTDNGSENLGVFADLLKAQDVTHYFARPHTPKDKPHVERFIGSLERECLQWGGVADDKQDQQRIIDTWLTKYHTYRPHQALGYLTPNEYHARLQAKEVALM
jgi:putative transposase